jgi:hypothetical protein
MEAQRFIAKVGGKDEADKLSILARGVSGFRVLAALVVERVTEGIADPQQGKPCAGACMYERDSPRT